MKKVLIVDDCPINGKIVSMHLKKNGIENQYIQNTQELNNLIDKSPELIDAIILDLVMPNTDGISILKKIRKNFSPIELPVIILTANDHQEQIIECLREGANDYLTKPAPKEVAIARLKTHLLIKKLNKQTQNKKEADAINGIVTTYGHEINNPLTVAMLTLQKNPEDISPEKITIVLNALKEIQEIVKKIENVVDKSIEYKNYTNDSKRKLIKL